jgi:hypothetical protein
MAGDLDSVLLDNVTYYRTQTGSIAIHLSVVPRLLLAGIGAVFAGGIAVAFLPLWLTLVAAALGAALVYTWAGRPSTLFDCHQRVMTRHSRPIPFAELEQFHMIERRDERRRLFGASEFGGYDPRLVVRYEVYTRFDGEPLVVAYCRSRSAATELVSELNALLATQS